MLKHALDEALEHAAQGRAVYPLRVDGVALTAHGATDATTDREQIRVWFGEKWPSAKVGVANGNGHHPKPATFFESIALPLIRDRGWKVVPCKPREKDVHGRLVPKPLEQMSCDLAQIRAWGTEEPDANVAVYAQQVEGGMLFLDKDGARDIREAYRADTGKDFRTLFVRSSVQKGVEKGHWYFLQTPKTRALAKNISESATGGWFSLRVKNEYVCSIGSIHPATGEPYQVLDDSPVAPMPDELLDWLEAQARRKPEGGKAEATTGREKLPKGTRYTALISEVGRLWARGWGAALTVERGRQMGAGELRPQRRSVRRTVGEERDRAPDRQLPARRRGRRRRDEAARADLDGHGQRRAASRAPR